MLKQRQVGILFDLFARAVGAGRYSVVAMPLVVSLIAAAVSMYEVDRPGEDAGEPVFLADATVADGTVPAEPAQAASADSWSWWAGTHERPAAARSAAAAQRAPLSLSPEQRNISRFVAKKYRVGIDEVQHLVALAYRAAREFRLDPYLVLAVMSIESNFNPNARSPAGAQGLMQVLTRVHVDKFKPFGGVTAAFDPMANITVGASILKGYLVREGSVEAALKSYVGAALLEHDSGYGYKVMSERERIAAAAAGRPIPTRPLAPPVVAAQAEQAAPAGSSAQSQPASAEESAGTSLLPVGPAPAAGPSSPLDAAAERSPDTASNAPFDARHPFEPLV